METSNQRVHKVGETKVETSNQRAICRGERNQSPQKPLSKYFLLTFSLLFNIQ